MGIILFISSILSTSNSLKFSVLQSTSRLISYGTKWSHKPKQFHKTLLDTDIKSKVIIVGDIHGCLDELKELLQKCEYCPQDTSVVLVGDLINKGPKSAEVVSFARTNHMLAVRGNHEERALEILGLPTEERPDKFSFVNEFTREDIAWISNLPYTISIPTLNAIVVHAGLLPDRSLNKQDWLDMTNMRSVLVSSLPTGEETAERDISGQQHKQKKLVGHHNAARDGVRIPWVNVWNRDPHVYFGHDAVSGLQLTEHCTGLDTGCCYGKFLTAVILPGHKIVQVAARQTYQEPNKKM